MPSRWGARAVKKATGKAARAVEGAAESVTGAVASGAEAVKQGAKRLAAEEGEAVAPVSRAVTGGTGDRSKALGLRKAAAKPVAFRRTRAAAAKAGGRASAQGAKRAGPRKAR